MKSHKRSLFFHILVTKAKNIKSLPNLKKALHYLCSKIITNKEARNSKERYSRNLLEEMCNYNHKLYGITIEFTKDFGLINNFILILKMTKHSYTIIGLITSIKEFDQIDKLNTY
jgi:spore coat polysaccharide biosynthesis protein SpsF (cytidylyltransferase family)